MKIYFFLLLVTQALAVDLDNPENEYDAEHTEDTPVVTTSHLSHLELLTCRYCKSGRVPSVLKFIKYDFPHYGNTIQINYKGKINE